MIYYVITVDDKPVYVCSCSEFVAKLRVEQMREGYRDKYNIKSSWKTKHKIDLIEVCGDETSSAQLPKLNIEDYIDE